MLKKNVLALSLILSSLILSGCGGEAGDTSSGSTGHVFSMTINSASISPLVVAAGESVYSSWNVTVEGAYNIYGMTVYISDSVEVTDSSIALDIVDIDCLVGTGACNSKDVSAILEIPDTTPAGTYHIIFQAFAFDMNLNEHYSQYVYPGQMTVTQAPSNN